MQAVGGAEPLGHEPLHAFTQELVAGVAEHLLDLVVHEQDPAGLVDADDRVRGGFEQLLEAALGRLPARHVADGRDRQRAVLGLDAREADLGRELAAVAAPAEELEARAHRARARVCHVARPVGGVHVAEPVGDEHLDGSTQELAAVIAEDPLDLTVDKGDPAHPVHADDSVRRRVEQLLEGALGERRALMSSFRHHRPGRNEITGDASCQTIRIARSGLRPGRHCGLPQARRRRWVHDRRHDHPPRSGGLRGARPGRRPPQ